MDCVKCGRVTERDYPACGACERAAHFNARRDCRCSHCWEARATAFRAEYDKLAEIAYNEELRYMIGCPVGATV